MSDGAPLSMSTGSGQATVTCAGAAHSPARCPSVWHRRTGCCSFSVGGGNRLVKRARGAVRLSGKAGHLTRRVGTISVSVQALCGAGCRQGGAMPRSLALPTTQGPERLPRSMGLTDPLLPPEIWAATRAVDRGGDLRAARTGSAGLSGGCGGGGLAGLCAAVPVGRSTGELNAYQEICRRSHRRRGYTPTSSQMARISWYGYRPHG
jgi:hypothetical protein